MRFVSLLEDINGYPLPSFLVDSQQHVEGPVKGIAALCESSVAFSSRNSLYLWNREDSNNAGNNTGNNTGNALRQIGSHNGLIWDLQVNPLTQEVVTAGGDGLVKIWSPAKASSPVELSVSQNDVYAVATHPLCSHLIAAGCFDGFVQLFDSEQRACLKVDSRSGSESRNTCRTRRLSPPLRSIPRGICCFRGERIAALRRGMW